MCAGFLLFLLKRKRGSSFSFSHLFWPIKFWRAMAKKHFWIFIVFLDPPPKLDHIIAFWICEPYNGNVKNKSIDHDTYTWWKWVMIYRVWFLPWGHFEPLSGLQECLLITWAWINKYVKMSVFRLRFITDVLSYIIEYFICEPYNENVKNNRIDHDTLISYDLIFIMN